MFRADLKNYRLDTVCTPAGYDLIFPWRETAVVSDGDEALCSREALIAQMSSGDLIGVALYEGRVVHHSLAQTRGTVVTESARSAFELQDKDAYIHYCKTTPGHQGKGIYTMMLHNILTGLAQEGYRNAYISCAQHNTASARGILKAGFAYDYSEKALWMLSGHIRLAFKCTEPDNLTVSKKVAR
jgi:ribosomal protein S18 acetylase RimI-like enzyme